MVNNRKRKTNKRNGVARPRAGQKSQIGFLPKDHSAVYTYGELAMTRVEQTTSWSGYIPISGNNWKQKNGLDGCTRWRILNPKVTFLTQAGPIQGMVTLAWESRIASVEAASNTLPERYFNRYIEGNGKIVSQSLSICSFTKSLPSSGWKKHYSIDDYEKTTQEVRNLINSQANDYCHGALICTVQSAEFIPVSKFRLLMEGILVWESDTVK